MCSLEDMDTWPATHWLHSRRTDLERTHQGVVHTHHCPGIVKLATVVGSREDGNKLALGKELVALFHNLRRAMQ